jgi:hypothetical protein
LLLKKGYRQISVGPYCTCWGHIYRP